MMSEIPKQFHLLGGKPLLLYSLEAFATAVRDIEIILVLPETHLAAWAEIISRYKISIVHTVVIGGTTRFQSVRNGLRYVKLPGLVAVHDGVRPLITPAGIVRLFAEAEKFGSAVPVIPINDTVRQKEGDSSHLVDRDKLCLVQTPEIFRSELLLSAYESPESITFTDVTSVVEAAGYHKVHLCEGDEENIKITRPLDFLIAEAILNRRSHL